ncbi:hypothetical protein ABI59_15530 [Acidobacteria bacterium Mor1]|nr:hypothetical protein ABI59_15530 [Acidobacteria bacterium Mor1]
MPDVPVGASAWAEGWTRVLSFQQQLVGGLFEPGGVATAVKVVLLLLPVLLFSVAAWTSALTLVTVPFRGDRRTVLVAMLAGWWDAARAVWNYQIAMLRFVVVGALGLLVTARLAASLAMELLRQLLITPLRISTTLGRSYFGGGLPWLAAALLSSWALMESAVFTHLLYPSVSKLLEDGVGVQAPLGTGPLLFAALTVAIHGSFAALHGFRRAVSARRPLGLLRSGMMTGLIACFEIFCVYGILAALAEPVLSRRFALHPGPWTGLLLVAFVWAAVRGTGWALFGRHGAEAWSALLARRRIEAPREVEAPSTTARDWASAGRVARDELAWLRRHARAELITLTVPVTGLAAAALNFALVPVLGRPWFRLPLDSLGDVQDGQAILAELERTVTASFEEPRRELDVEPEAVAEADSPAEADTRPNAEIQVTDATEPMASDEESAAADEAARAEVLTGPEQPGTGWPFPREVRHARPEAG